MRRLFLFAALAAPAGSLSAQMAAPAAKAVETITTEDVARRIRIVADDSMGGRDTPSRGLELTAQYVADEFKRFGLKPGGENGTWFQRYTISQRQLNTDQSRVVFAAKGQEVVAGFANWAALITGAAPEKPLTGPTLLVAGPHTLESVRKLKVSDKIVLYIAPTAGDSVVRQQVIQYLIESSKTYVVLTKVDSATFVGRVKSNGQPRRVIGTATASVAVLPSAVKSVLDVVGIDVPKERAATTPVAREIPDLSVRLEMKDEVLKTISAPNTIGILEGTDPKLKHEYIVFSAHMDHIGITPGQPDSINNGADDDGSGTVGIMELAEAYSQKGAQPKRSLVFMTVSGEEKGLLGSGYFTEHPTIPLQQVVADLNIDMIGRNWKDTVVAIGKEHSDLGATLNRVAAAHPELHMAPIDDRWPDERFYFRSDHYNFARKGVPILFFFSGVHEDYHQVTDSPDKIDAEKESRILRLIYYLGHEIGSADQRPKWNEASYKQIVEGAGR